MGADAELTRRRSALRLLTLRAPQHWSCDLITADNRASLPSETSSVLHIPLTPQHKARDALGRLFGLSPRDRPCLWADLMARALWHLPACADQQSEAARKLHMQCGPRVSLRSTRQGQLRRSWLRQCLLLPKTNTAG